MAQGRGSGQGAPSSLYDGRLSRKVNYGDRHHPTLKTYAYDLRQMANKSNRVPPIRRAASGIYGYDLHAASAPRANRTDFGQTGIPVCGTEHRDGDDSVETNGGRRRRRACGNVGNAPLIGSIRRVEITLTRRVIETSQLTPNFSRHARPLTQKEETPPR